jgi:hypothetical protein
MPIEHESAAPERLGEINDLKVAARCGCGKCPTVLFSNLLDGEPLTGPFTALASFRGVNEDGVTVGVVLLERNGQIAELEAWSPIGEDTHSWPSVSQLAPEL